MEFNFVKGNNIDMNPLLESFEEYKNFKQMIENEEFFPTF